jgi:hypothetical protein
MTTWREARDKYVTAENAERVAKYADEMLSEVRADG